MIKVGDIVSADPSDYKEGMSIECAKALAHNEENRQYLLSSKNLPEGGFWILGKYEDVENIRQVCSSTVQDLELYEGEKCWWVEAELVTLVESVSQKPYNKNGCYCKRCNEYYPFAESNQADGSLLCYSCKIWE